MPIASSLGGRGQWSPALVPVLAAALAGPLPCAHARAAAGPPPPAARCVDEEGAAVSAVPDWVPRGYVAGPVGEHGVVLVTSRDAASVSRADLERLVDETCDAFEDLLGPDPALPAAAGTDAAGADPERAGPRPIVLGQLATYSDYGLASEATGRRVFGTIEMDVARDGILVPDQLMAFWIENLDGRAGYREENELVHRLAQLLLVRRHPHLGTDDAAFWRLGVAYHLEDEVTRAIHCVVAGVDLDAELDEQLARAAEEGDARTVKSVGKELDRIAADGRARQLAKLFDERRRDLLTADDFAWATSRSDLRFASDARGVVAQLEGIGGLLPEVLAAIEGRLAAGVRPQGEALDALLTEHVAVNAYEFLGGATRTRRRP